MSMFRREMGAARLLDACDQAGHSEELFAFPLSPEQDRIWRADRETPGNSAYNAAYRWDLNGRLDCSILERTFKEIVRRHENLRSTFVLLDGAPRQVVAKDLPILAPVSDLRALSQGERDAAVERICAEEAVRGFDLEKGPLIRVGLIRVADEHHVLTVTLHHIVCDGWSIRVLMEELRQIYPAFAAGREPSIPELPIQYGDFVIWQREQIESGAYDQQSAYWRTKLAGYQRLEIPADVSSQAERVANGAITSIQLPRSLTDRLRQFSNDQGGTMFSTALAACMVLLHRYTGRTDIAVGSPVAGRSRTELEPLVGLLVNHVVLRAQAGHDLRFVEFANQVRDAVWEAMANQDLPFANVLSELEKSGQTCPRPFYAINFVCQRAFGGTETFTFEFDGIRVSTIPSKSQGALYDLNFFLIERETGWRLSLEYNTDLYSDTGARQMVEDFQRTLEAVAADPQRKLREFSISANATLASRAATEPADQQDVGQAIVSQSGGRSGGPGADAEDGAEVYALPVSVTQERFWLLTKVAQNRAVFNMPAAVRITGPLSPEILERSFQHVVERQEILRTTFSESQGKLVQRIASRLVVSLPVSDLEHVEEREREAILRQLLQEEAQRSFDLERGPLCRARLFRLHSNEHVLIATLHHIISDGWSHGILQRDLWSTYVALEEGREPELPELAIQYADFTAWQNEWLASDEAQKHLDYWLKQLSGPLPILDIATRPPAQPTAGHGIIETRQLPDALIQKLKKLGQSENATMFMLTLSAFAVLLSRYSGRDDVVIGSPTANRRAETESLVGPFSAPFALRLKLAGSPTLRDVLRHATKISLDAMDHIELPFEVLFKQLKMRSVHGRNPLFQFYFFYQSAFLQSQQLQRLAVSPLPALSVGTPFELQLAVIERPDGVRANIDYDLARFDAATVGDVLRYYEYVLGEFAANPDKAVADLDAPSGTQPRSVAEANAPTNQEYIEPRDEVEAELAAIYKEIFELPRVGIRDDFFALGGHSLLAARMLARVESTFGVSFDLSTIVVAPTVERLAEKVKAGLVTENSHLVPLRQSGTKPPLFCIHAAGGHVITYRPFVDRLPEDQPVYGLQAPQMDGARQSTTVEQLAAIYIRDIRRVQPHGPYQLCGLSFGGLMAYEIAVQLANAGEQVGVVALFDAGNPAYYRNLPPWTWVQFRMTYLLDRLHKYGRNLLEWRLDEIRSDLNQFFGKRLSTYVWQLVKRACKIAKRPMPSGMRDTVILFSDIGRAYTPQPYEGRIFLFRASGRTPEYLLEPTLGWTGLAQDGVVVHHVEGGHVTMIMPPNVDSLVEQLIPYLARDYDATRDQLHSSPARSQV